MAVVNQRVDTRPRPRWRFARLSLRGMIVLVLVLGGSLGWLARQSKPQRDAVAAIKSAGGMALYDRKYGNWNNPSSRSAWVEWLVDQVGVDYFENIVHVELTKNGSDASLGQVGNLNRLAFLWLDQSPVTDEGLAHLAGLTELQVLSLENTKLTDLGLAELKHLNRLETLRLGGTRVTDAGMVHVQQLDQLVSA